jgi:hypothetical protein
VPTAVAEIGPNTRQTEFQIQHPTLKYRACTSAAHQSDVIHRSSEFMRLSGLALIHVRAYLPAETYGYGEKTRNLGQGK